MSSCVVSLEGLLHPSSAVYREGYATCLEDSFTLVPVALVFFAMLPSIINKPKPPSSRLDVMEVDALHGAKIFTLKALGWLAFMKFVVQYVVGYPRHIVLATGNLLIVALLGLILVHYTSRQMLQPAISPRVVWLFSAVTSFIRVYADYKMVKSERIYLRSWEIYRMMDQTSILFTAGITILFLMEVLSPVKIPKQDIKRKHGRKASFVTTMLAKGSFPVEKKIPQPIIHNVIWLNKLPPYAQLAEKFDNLFRKWDRFLSTPTVNRDKSITLQPYGLFDIHGHITKKYLSDESQFKDYLESLFFINMDLTKPPIHLHFVDVENGRSAIIIVVHHMIGDGYSLLAATRELFTDAAGNPIESTIPIGRPANINLRQGVCRRLQNIVKATITTFQTLVKCATLPYSWSDTKTFVNNRSDEPYHFNGNRRVVFAPPISFATIKHVKDNVDGTVNDVLTGLLAGAYRRYNDEEKRIELERKKPQGTTLEEEQSVINRKDRIRALVPVAFPRSDYNVLRNLWCFVSVALPVDEPVPISRVRAARELFDKAKMSKEAYIQLSLQRVFSSLLGSNPSRNFAFNTMTKHTCVFTNLPGPRETVYFLNEPVLAMAPVVANLIQQVTMVSYNGEIHANFVVDPNLVRRPERLGECLLEELKDLEDRIWVFRGKKYE